MLWPVPKLRCVMLEVLGWDDSGIIAQAACIMVSHSLLLQTPDMDLTRDCQYQITGIAALLYSGVDVCEDRRMRTERGKTPSHKWKIMPSASEKTHSRNMKTNRTSVILIALVRLMLNPANWGRFSIQFLQGRISLTYIARRTKAKLPHFITAWLSLLGQNVGYRKIYIHKKYFR